jgi:hypothetical protein
VRCDRSNSDEEWAVGAISLLNEVEGITRDEVGRVAIRLDRGIVVALEGGVPVAIGGGVYQNCKTRSISVHLFSRGIRLNTVCSIPAFREWFVIIGRCV